MLQQLQKVSAKLAVAPRGTDKLAVGMGHGQGGVVMGHLGVSGRDGVDLETIKHILSTMFLPGLPPGFP